MTTSLTGNNNFPKSFADSRDDLGYGRLSPKYHKDRSIGGSSFPYVEPPTNLDHVEIDDTLINLILNKLDIPRDYDPLPTLDSEGQYFVSGNTKLSESPNTAPSIPGLYKNRTRTSIGAPANYPHGPAPGFTSNSRPTGSKYGFSTMYNDTEESDDPVYTAEDLAKKQIKELRYYIRSILLMELK